MSSRTQTGPWSDTFSYSSGSWVEMSQMRKKQRNNIFEAASKQHRRWSWCWWRWRPEWWEEWDYSQASKRHRHCGQCTRVQSWIKAIEEPAEKKKVKLSVVLKKRENCLFFSRNSSGRRTVNGSLSSFTSSTTIASMSWSGCEILQDWGQSHSSGLFRKGGPGHPPQMKTCSDMHEHESPKHETSFHLEFVIWNKS